MVRNRTKTEGADLTWFRVFAVLAGLLVLFLVGGMYEDTERECTPCRQFGVVSK